MVSQSGIFLLFFSPFPTLGFRYAEGEQRVSYLRSRVRPFLPQGESCVLGRASAREQAGMGREQAQLLQQEDFVVLSAVLHEARAAALASSASTADGDVDLSLLEVCMRQCPHPRCARARPAPTLLPAARRAT